jgi:nicotinamidase-related amidase
MEQTPHGAAANEGKGMLETDDCCLVIVDAQGKLAQLMVNKETLIKNIRILAQAARLLDVPIIWCQQVPDALGPTVPEIAELLTDIEPINKASFSCWGHESFRSHLQAGGRRQVLLCGIETHVCIYQTGADLIRHGFDVTVVADAVSSRTAENRQIGLNRVASAGAKVSSTEMALFELLKTAEHPQFRQIAKLVK